MFDPLMLALMVWIVPGIIGSLITDIVDHHYSTRHLSIDAVLAHVAIGAFLGLAAFGGMLWIVCCDVYLRLRNK